MQIREVMSPKPEVLEANASIREVAMRMRDDAIGIMPVNSGQKLIGMVTDRDIVIRAIAEGKNPDDQISDIVTDAVLYCFENDDVKNVLHNMHEQEVQRLIVLNNPESKDLVGIVSVADIADKCRDDESVKAIAESVSHYH